MTTFPFYPAAFSQKSLFFPAPGRRPTFDSVADIVLTGTRFNLSGCVLCLTQEMLDRWQAQLENGPASVTLLDVLNSNQATLEDWQAFLGNHPHDITVFSGALSELEAGRLSAEYLYALVEAVPSGLVIFS